MTAFIYRLVQRSATLILLIGVIQPCLPRGFSAAQTSATRRGSTIESTLINRNRSSASRGTTRRGRAIESSVGWNTVPAILARIKPPTFPARDFNIVNYGAAPGGQTDSTEAIRKAI